MTNTEKPTIPVLARNIQVGDRLANISGAVQKVDYINGVIYCWLPFVKAPVSFGQNEKVRIHPKSL